MKYLPALFLSIFIIALSTNASAFEVRHLSTTHTLHTVSSFIDLLIERGIIHADRAAQARAYGSAIERVHSMRASELSTVPELDITASQLIEYSKLTFGRFEDIQGLVLLVRNTGTQGVVLEHPQECPVTYRIYGEDGEILYDSTKKQQCANSETVRYVLDSRQVRMFEIEHRHRDRALTPGVYRFEMHYANYGSDVRAVTIR